jgi:hypothetical protein
VISKVQNSVTLGISLTPDFKIPYLIAGILKIMDTSFLPHFSNKTTSVAAIY